MDTNKDVTTVSQSHEETLYTAKLEILQNQNNALKKENKDLFKEVSELSKIEVLYHDALNSFAWKITKPLRFIDSAGKQMMHLAKKTRESLKDDGIAETIRKIRGYSFQKGNELLDIDYLETIVNASTYMEMHKPTATQLEFQRKHHFAEEIKFSILVPLYNTPKSFLVEMIDSVIDQSYENWELCLADGSEAGFEFVQGICQAYTNLDSRIVYKKLEKNDGISGNTNACLDMATGDYIALFDHDDLLAPNALYENMIRIEDGADFIYSDEMVFKDEVDNCTLIHFKPNFSPETLRGHNYICHLSVFSKELSDKVGYFSKEHNGSQDYDMALRLTEQAKKIVHIPEVLYYWRNHEASVASDVSVKPYCMVSAKKAIHDQLERKGLRGEVVDSMVLSTYRVKYEIKGEPLVSIIIANKENTDILNTCITSIEEISRYKNYEIIVVENNSKSEKTFKYYDKIVKKYPNISVVKWPESGFNYSAINNFGVEKAKGEYILLLNNDTKVITSNWLEEMLMFAQRDDVGVVGAKLLFPDDTIQHAGVAIGIGGFAAHMFSGFDRNDGGYIHRTCLAQDLSCVTGACLFTKKSVWNEVGGLDEGFKVALNDVDFCLKVRKAGYSVIYTPYAELYHYESKSRGYENSPEKINRFNTEVNKFMVKWEEELEEGDPFYNPHLSLERIDFAINGDSKRSFSLKEVK